MINLALLSYYYLILMGCVGGHERSVGGDRPGHRRNYSNNNPPPSSRNSIENSQKLPEGIEGF